MATTRKQISFDLDTKQLEIYYPKDNWRNAYLDIRKYMLKNDFEWQQGSVYVSKEPLLPAAAQDIVKHLTKENPWLNKCMNDCIIANIGRSHNLNFLFDKEANIKTREELIADQTMSILKSAVAPKNAFSEGLTEDISIDKEFEI